MENEYFKLHVLLLTSIKYNFKINYISSWDGGRAFGSVLFCATKLHYFSFFFFLVTVWILSYILLQHVSVMYTAQYPVRLRYVWLKKQNGVDICLGQNQDTDDWPGFYDTIWLSICHFSHLSHFISMQQKSDICFQLVFLKMSPSVHTNTQTLWFYRLTSAARHNVKLWHFIKENI